MKKPELIFLWVLFSAGFALHAQDIFQRPLSDDTLPEFSRICTGLSAHPVVKGTFEQIKTIARLGRSLKSRGNFIIASDLGMVWDTLAPFPSAMAVGRDFIIQTTSAGVKSKLDARGNETFTSLADTISAIFTGNSQKLREKFDNYFTEDKKSGTWTVGLVPKDSAVRVFAQNIVLSGKTDPSIIQSIEIHSQNGDLITYTLAGHYFPQALSADEKALFSL
ncbi:MAG: outer membrane lipoprotein carrier protein LolA [Treponema sp.]|nr:outer membrane lipoprotein carrier protein LolA [Treponema sp.]